VGEAWMEMRLSDSLAFLGNPHGDGQIDEGPPLASAETHSLEGTWSRSAGTIDYEGDTVGTTVTYLTHLSVAQVIDSSLLLSVDGMVISIPYAEQEDHPDLIVLRLPRWKSTARSSTVRRIREFS